MYYATLADRVIVALSGDDVHDFLQGLITNDVGALEKHGAIYAAMLSPQGKFLHDFFVVAHGDEIWLDVNKARADDLLARLKTYKLRSKVNISLRPDVAIRACWGEGALQGIPDPRLVQMGTRIYGEFVAPTQAEEADYEAHRIALGMFDGAKDMLIDKSLLLEFAFEDVHGVSFSKGCYVGQEVTARSKFRGQVRKHLFQVHAEKPLPAPDTLITLQGAEVGVLRSVSGHVGLAVLRMEDVSHANEMMPLMANDVAITATFPTWATPVKIETA